MSILIGTFGLFLAAGLFFIASALLKIPSLAASRAVMQTIRRDKRETRNKDAVLLELAVKLGKYIKIDAYKRRRLDALLKSAGIAMTPETYQAKAIIKAGFAALGILPSLLIFPLASVVFIFLAVALYVRETRSADEALKKRRENIESELPRFVATITQHLKASRDVLSMLEKYRGNAGKEVRAELDITVADMQTGNLETALMRWESRLGSAMLSDVVRGLVSVIRGDDGVTYFEMLAHDFKLMEIQKLKLIAMKRPGKIKKYSMMLLFCFMAMYLGILFVEILDAFGNLF